MDNPAKDAALIERIGAKKVDMFSGAEYALNNAETDTRFTFEWTKGYGNRPSNWRLFREKE